MTPRKIALIQPPHYRLFDDNFSYAECPLSLGYLSNTVKQHTDWDVVAYNADFNRQQYIGNENVTFSYRSEEGYKRFVDTVGNKDAPIWDEIRSALKEINPSVIGISTMSQNFKSACMIARIAKELNKDVVVVVGGPHPSMVGAEVLDCPHIDMGAMGEGERTIVELLQAVAGEVTFSSVNGLVYRDNGVPVTNSPRELNQDLDSLAYPHQNARELLKDFDLYPKSAFSNVLASRGCPYSCTFCGSRNIWGQKVRMRSPANILEELKHLHGSGIGSVRFADDTFGLHKAWTKEVCDGISRECHGLKWKCEVNVNLITDDFLRLVKTSGCHMIELGVESGDNGILKQIKKNITIEQAIAACKLVNKHNIELQAYIIIGFPDETEETLQRTRDAIQKISGYIWLSVFNPFPGTVLYRECMENGLIDEGYEITLHNYQNLDSFCKHIPRQRFKEIARTIMAEVDEKNRKNRIQRIFSLNTFWRIKEMGILNAVKKGIRILLPNQ